MAHRLILYIGVPWLAKSPWPLRSNRLHSDSSSSAVDGDKYNQTFSSIHSLASDELSLKHGYRHIRRAR